MKSLPIKSGITRSIMMVAGLFVGVRVLVALLEQFVFLLVYYF
jgi:hypothetical protein